MPCLVASSSRVEIWQTAVVLGFFAKSQNPTGTKTEGFGFLGSSVNAIFCMLEDNNLSIELY